MTPDGSTDVQRLQARVRELEGQLKASRTAPPTPVPADRMKLVAAVLAGTSVVMAVPAFITVRRWVLWWR